MGRKRTKETWDEYFILSKKYFKSMEDLWDEYKNESLLRTMASTLRNPIVFDNHTVETRCLLPYKCDLIYGDNCNDHLIGMSNIVLYIYKRKLYKKWVTVQDFIQTLKSLQVTLIVPKNLNTNSGFKTWQFNIKDIGSCIYWNEKLKQNNIDYLVGENGEKVSVDDIWLDWYVNNKKFL